MGWRHELKYFIRKLNRNRAEREAKEEIRTHLELETEEKMNEGLAEEEARHAARRAFGSVAYTKEQSRAIWGFGFLETCWQDLRFAFRRMKKSKAFTLIAVLSLALGIGANTSVFSLVNTILLRPLPVKNPDRLVSLNIDPEKGGGGGFIVSYLNYRDLRDRNQTLDGLIAYRMAAVSLSQRGNNDRAWGYLASGNYFDVLGVKPALGRLLSPEDDLTQGAHPVTVISHDCWQKRFAGAPDIVGRDVLVNAQTFTIIGVAPPGFYGVEIGYVSEMWFPIMMLDQIIKWGNDLQDRDGQSYMVQGMLKPGVSPAQAEASLNVVMKQLAVEYPKENRGLRVTLSPPGLLLSYLRKPVMSFINVLMISAGLVLLLACLNLANLLLARAMERRKEIAIRLAIGAGRARIVRQLLTESLLLAIVGGVVGLSLAYGLVNAVMGFKPPIDFPISSTLYIDHRVLIFTFVVSLLTSVIFGLLPALQSTKPDLAPVLKEETSTGGTRKSYFRNSLIIFQVALSLALLVGAGLAMRGLGRAHSLNVGFTPQHAILMSFDLGLQGYSGSQSKLFKQQLLDGVRAMPGVQAAGIADYVPFNVMTRRTFIFAEGAHDQALDPQAKPPSALRGSAGPGFLPAFGARFLQGRDFTPADNASGRRMAVVNETVAQLLWQEEPAIGKRFSFGPGGPWIEVIGVLQNGKYESLNDAESPLVYTNLEDEKGGNGLTLNLVVRTENTPQNVIAAIRREFGRLDPNLPVFNVKTLADQLGLALFPARVAALLLGGFGFLALLLSGVGLFGVMSCSVNQRRREIGVRIALGANAAHIFKAVIGQGMLLTVIGVIVGLLLAAFGARLMTSLLYGAGVFDPLIFAGVPLVLALVAFLACFFPARKATKVDPISVLRAE